MGCREDCGEEIWSKSHPRENCIHKHHHPCKNESNSTQDTSNIRSKNSIGSTHFTEKMIKSESPRRNGESKPNHNYWLYRGNKINLARFLRFHPGGTPSLKIRMHQDLESSMISTNHSSEAYYLLRDFYNGNSNEDIVDWNKAMLSQVGSLGPLYESWVWSPVDRPLRLFEYNWLEKLTRTNWQQVVGVWVPVIAIASLLSYYDSPMYYALHTRVLGVLIFLLCGMAVWPLLEYSIHRWLFHLQPPKNSSLLITIHFGLHGLHHKVPFDEGRLLFPPGPCSVMALALYNIYTRLFPWWIAMAFFSGTMLGYLIYDLIHYYLHHGNPKEGTYLYHMKRYHNQHHFAQQEKGFGISSDFWDHAFDTLIKLKKLSKPLTWES